jgi:hypothetical protein
VNFLSVAAGDKNFLSQTPSETKAFLLKQGPPFGPKFGPAINVG